MKHKDRSASTDINAEACNYAEQGPLVDLRCVYLGQLDKGKCPTEFNCLRIITMLVFMATLALSTNAQTTSVLFVGNSYTSVNDLPLMFQQLALDLGDSTYVEMHAPGGSTLQDHSTDNTTMNRIESRDWNYVVMQEQSQIGAFPIWLSSMWYGAGQLSAEITANYECTTPVFYMTWGREFGDADNCFFFPNMCTYQGMHQALLENYVSVAFANQGTTAPVGVAWDVVLNDQPTIDLYQPDGSHPTVTGTYLAACVLYSTLFQQPCVGSSFNASLSPSVAATLQGIASTTVLGSLETWNLNVQGSTDASFTTTQQPWSNDITCHHNGQGDHWWSCTNGQTSASPEPTFSFNSVGPYTIKHVYNDPCGRSDTALWFGEALPVGIAGLNESIRPCGLVASGPGMVEVVGDATNIKLLLSDLQGRTLVEQRINRGQTRFACPTGVHLWRVTDERGNVCSGKVLVQ